MNTPSMSYGEHMRRNEFSKAASRQDGVGPGGHCLMLKKVLGIF